MANTRPKAKGYTNPSFKRSDHPSFEEKKHSLLIDSQGASNREIQTESGTLRFEDGIAVLPDDSRAKDIYDEIQVKHASHPGHFTLVEDKPTVNTDPVHRYTFGYTRGYAENFDRVFRNPEDDKEELKDGKSEIDTSAGDSEAAREGIES